MPQSDLYSILGVSKGASLGEIKKAYRELARRHHPDRNPGDKQAEERFKEISAAFAVLGDDKKRKIYDEFGPDGLREGFDPEAARNYQRFAGGFGGGGGFGGFPGGFGGFGGGNLGGFGDLEELLGGLFGGGGGFGGGPRQRVQRKGADIERVVTLSVREAVEGKDLEIEGGKIRIPSGVADGQRMRISGKGAVGAGGRGDLYLNLEVATPPGFTRDGDDLIVDVPLRLSQAIKGDAVELPTPEAKTLRMKIPAGIQSGQRLRIRNRGMPVKGGARGHLFARAQIMAPMGGDRAELERLAEALDAHY